MLPFELHTPTRLFFGPQYGPRFAQQIASTARKVLIVTGGGSVERLGYLDHVKGHLDKAGIAWSHERGVEPNPHAATVNRIASSGAKWGAEAVLAVGGGSVMDAAKAIGGLIANAETDIWEFVLGSPRRGQLQASLPIFCVPTTAASASEVTPYAVISHPPVNGKSPVSSPHFKPLSSWLNPEFTHDVPLETTRDGASDILSHVFENYLLGGDTSPLADAISEGVMRTVMEALPAVTSNLRDTTARARLMWASTVALNGYPTAGREPSAFVLHNIEHAMSGVNPALAHGRGLATLYPAYFQWLWDRNRARNRFERLGRDLFRLEGGQSTVGRRFLDRFTDWLEANGLYQSASAVGVGRDRFEAVADYTVRIYGDGTQLQALGPMTRDDILTILTMTERQIPRSSGG